MSAAAPENNLCGLAIDIEMLNDESVYNPIECTSGVDRRQFSIMKNSILRLTSRIIPGNFTRGYCMHIIRDSSDTMFISIGAGIGSLFIIIVGIIVIVIRRQGCKIKKPMSTANLNMQYDNLSESRNTSSYSTLDRPTTDHHPYDVVL